MVKHMVSTWFCLCVLLTACSPQEVRTQTIYTKQNESTATLSEEKTPIVLATSTITETMPGGSTVNQILYPIFVFLEGDILMKQIGSNTPQQIVALPDLGPIKDAILKGGTLILLREQGIQSILLSETTIDTLIRFDMPILEGGLINSANDRRLFYFGTDSEQKTNIGYFELDKDIGKPAFSFPQNLQVLGLTEDGQGLYCLPVGQDPEFNKVLLIDISKDEISRELPVRGVSFAALAPDARSLSTFAQVPGQNGQLDSVINLYDLPSLPLTPPRVFNLPKTPSFVGFGGLRWSPNSQDLYFMLIENIYEAPSTISYGLWRLNVQNGKMDQITPISDPTFHIEKVSPDGTWILLSHETINESIIVNSTSGKIQSLTVPDGATFAGWR